ncbi:MAG: B12-binding domain-containing radical SAM protein [Elusimicrobia bacterium]|nr:B12-binding domain-containing radical SAM protein [Elusimicrobiota bacterium]
MAIIQALREDGFDPFFYDIDGLRPSFEETERFFAERKPDVLGISAVVSTAYTYTKRLTAMVRRVSPKTRIVLGGNMAASAELLHRLAGVEICVIGEGEVVSVNLMRALQACTGGPLDYEALGQVKGLTYLDPRGEMTFTGYELSLPAKEVFKPDFTILEQFSRISNFVTDPMERSDFALDPRSHEAHRRGKKQINLVTAKGCVARCTFCHRWDKGYRPIPVDDILTRLGALIERYNVGFVQFSDENFGSDRRQTEEFIRRIKAFDILWEVGGVRVRSVDPDLLRRMKDAGCVAVYYGMETGSPRILEIMEKKATLQNNLDAARWTREAGLFTIFQMVLAMPGETPDTVAETADFLKQVTQDMPVAPRSLMSLNYIQALPGTPVYEYARHKGLIGRSLAAEEAYLMTISDIDAADDTKFLNFTDHDMLTVRSWRREIILDVVRHYYERQGHRPPPLWKFLLSRVSTAQPSSPAHPTADHHEHFRQRVIREYQTGGYFNIQRDMGYDLIVAYFWPLRRAALAMSLFRDELRRLSLGIFLEHLRDWARSHISSRKTGVPTESLRSLMTRLTPPALTPTEGAMAPLRAGR